MIKNASLVEFDEDDMARLIRPKARRLRFPIPENGSPGGLRPSRDNPMLLGMATQIQARAGKKAPAGRQPKPGGTPTWVAENRHHVLLQYLAQCGPQGAQIQAILRHLADHAGKGSYAAKTVYRDIEHLVDDFGYTIQHDKVRNRWVFHNPPPTFTLGSRRLSKTQMIALRMAASPIAIPGHPFQKAMQGTLQQIAEMLDDDQKKQLLDSAQLLNVKNTPLIDLDVETIDLLEGAIREKREVTMKYRSLNDPRHLPRRVQPHGLYHRNGGWYLAAYNPQSKAMRSYLIYRARDWTLTQKPFLRQKNFTLDEFLHGSFGAMSGTGPLQKVRVRLFGAAARLGEERRWHSSQRTKSDSRRKDGSVVVSFELRGLDEVRRWILQWEGEAEVLKPKALKDQVRAAGKKIGMRS